MRPYLRLIPRSAVLVLATLLLFARDVWKEKPFTEWTKEETASLLQDSPWGKTQTIQRGDDSWDVPGSSEFPDAGTGGSTAGSSQPGSGSDVSRFTITFLTAVPIRMAYARWGMLSGRFTAEQAQNYVNQSRNDDYVVVSLGSPFPQDRSKLEALSTDALGENTYLRLKKTKRKIYPERYLPPSKSNNGEAQIYFPRREGANELLTLAEQEIEFRCRVHREIRLKKKFKLEKMVFDGTLEL